MAKLKTFWDKNFDFNIEKIANNSRKTGEKMVKVGADECLKIVRVNLANAIGSKSKRYYQTGELLGSLGVTDVNMSYSGLINAKVGFRENGKGTMTNAAKAANLENGNIQGQQPTGFMRKSIRKAKPIIEKTMGEIFEKETKIE